MNYRKFLFQEWIKKNFVFSNRFIMRSSKEKQTAIENSTCLIRKVSHVNIEDARWFNADDEIKMFYDFLSEGYKGYYAYVNDKCVHRIWVFSDSKRAIIDDMFVYEVGGDLMVTWGLTQEDYRGYSVYKKSLNFLLEDNGDKYIYGSLNPKNISSYKGLVDQGFIIFKRIIVLRFFRFKLWLQYKKNEKCSIKVGFGGKVS